MINNIGALSMFELGPASIITHVFGGVSMLYMVDYIPAPARAEQQVSN